MSCSTHEVQVFRVFSISPNRWFTNRDVAEQSGVAYRTGRLHTSRLTKLGVLDQEQLFPGYRFRLASKLTRPAQEYVKRLEAAAEIFGLLSKA